tara:strand:- start:3159 stop:3857 length:699 start_codon:yes stop_codon:yes gene_type:complete
MKFDKKTLSETINSELSGNKYFTNGKKQNIIVNESQLDRLLMKVNDNNPTKINNMIIETFKIIREAIVKENLDLNVADYSETLISESQDEWRGHNPGASAAAGIENIISSVKKAYDMIKDSDTRRKLANSITKLGNFMTYTAELIGSGSSQRAPRSYDDVSDDLPYPDLEETTKDVAEEASVIDKMKERGRGDDGTQGEDDTVEETVKEEKERLIREDIKMMKQIISPISRI